MAMVFDAEVTGSTFNALISACARKGDVDRAEFWLKRMRASSQAPRRQISDLFIYFFLHIWM